MAVSFDLVTQPWIPVRQTDRLIEVSLADALLRAREFQGIEDPSPLVTAALHRFLLAVLHRALGETDELEETAEWFREGFPVGKVRGYLEQYHDRFDLFDPAQPFYQVPDFTLEQSSRSWTILAPELNSDNNKVLFDHTLTARPEPLRPAQAARLLIANQTFALGGGKSFISYTSNAPLATAAFVLVQGTNLCETLCLNLGRYVGYDHDRAIWEAQSLTVAQIQAEAGPARAPLGWADLFTWPTRAIRLHPEEFHGATAVVRISYASGVPCSDPAAIPDPLIAYRRNQKETTRIYPLVFREDRALWRDFHALLPDGGGEGAAVLDYAGRLYRYIATDGGGIPPLVEVLVLGQANNKAKVEFWRMERYRLPGMLLGDYDLRALIDTCLEAASETGQRLNGAARALAERLLTRGERKPHKDDVTKLVNSFPHGAAYWSSLERAFGDWLARLRSDAVEQSGNHRRAWLNTVDREARRAWDLTARAAGDDARALRAIFASEGLLLTFLAKQRKEAA